MLSEYLACVAVVVALAFGVAVFIAIAEGTTVWVILRGFWRAWSSAIAPPPRPRRTREQRIADLERELGIGGARDERNAR